MANAGILTPWTGSGTVADPHRPQLADDYPAVSVVGDVSAQDAGNVAPDPNLAGVEIEADAATITAIEADDAYSLLWSTNPRPRDGKPDAAEYGAAVSFLARAGVPAAKRRELLGTPGKPHRRSYSWDTLNTWARGLS